jgi:hypothetical protein
MLNAEYAAYAKMKRLEEKEEPTYAALSNIVSYF